VSRKILYDIFLKRCVNIKLNFENKKFIIIKFDDIVNIVYSSLGIHSSCYIKVIIE